MVPSAVAISSYPGDVPISTLPTVLEVGVIDVIVLNKPNDETVLPEVGPAIVSVLLSPSVSVPAIVKVFSLSLPVDVMETLVPEDEAKAGMVPTSISPESPSTFTSVTAVSYTHLRAHETKANLVCRLLLEKKK